MHAMETIKSRNFSNARHATGVTGLTTSRFRANYPNVRWHRGFIVVSTGSPPVFVSLQDGAWAKSYPVLECDSGINRIEFPEAIGSE
jgi:hypothetical protein